jgi:hypothetical protein
VVGAFAGLSEGDTLPPVDGVTYRITYQYNAEAGTFGDGNDVALVSSLFSESWAKGTYTRWIADPALAQQVLDADVRFSHTDATADQYQLTEHQSQYDPDWAAGAPDFSYQSLNPYVATVDSNGLVQFVQNGSCTIVVTASEDGYDDRTFAINLTGQTYGGETTKVYTPITITSENVGSYVLVLYNADSQDSIDLKDYYLEKRRGFAGASTLPIYGVPDAHTAPGEYLQSIGDQVRVWMSDPDHPERLTIRYVIGLCGLPSGDGNNGFGETPASSSALYYVAQATNDIWIDGIHRYGPGYNAANEQNDRYSVAEYGEALVAWLDCGSYASTIAYIDKLAAAADSGGLCSDGITISGQSTTAEETTWVLDDTRTGYDGSPQFPAYQTAIEAAIPSGEEYSIAYSSNVPLTVSSSSAVTYYTQFPSMVHTAANVTFYGGWGHHNNNDTFGPTWPIDGSVVFTGKSNWFLVEPIESFCGMYVEDPGPELGHSYANQSTWWEYFAADSFGGTDYSNTAICFVGYTTESGLLGTNNSNYAEFWARGWTTAEAAWGSARTTNFLFVGDPLVVR